ncbi:MAG: hypothetical protein KJ767_02980 [Nanoarchaeota archaeon]|nr:hypothetical protein [Nanoarchaeota archaeon]
MDAQEQKEEEKRIIDPDRFNSTFQLNPEKLDGNNDGTFFATEDELLQDELLQDKHKVLYFLRNESYHTLHDFPVCGPSEDVLTSSSIDGPFPKKPQEQKQESDFNFNIKRQERIIKKYILPRKIPKEFDEVKLFSYGMNDGNHFDMAYNDFYGDINREKIKEVGEKVTAKLENFNDDRFLVHLNYSDEFSGPFFRIHVFSKSDFNPRCAAQELGALELKDAFERPDAYIVHPISQCSKHGLAYNLDLKKVDIKDIIYSNLENIIL